MTNISLRQLQYFLALVEAGSFSRAADKMGVTQSTLSAAIQSLEMELGVLLIDRGGRRIQLLPAGEDLVLRIREIVTQVSELPEHAKRAARPLTTRLRMGVIPSIAPYLLPKILPSTAEHFPDLHLSIREGLTRNLLDAIRAGSLDVALIAAPYQFDDFEAVEVGHDPFMLAIPKEHHLSGRELVQTDDVRGEPLLLLESGHCLREHVMAAVGMQPQPGGSDVHATSISTLVQMVAFGMGVTLLPELAVKAGAAFGTDIGLIPYSGENGSRSLVLVWRNGAARRKEYQLFAGHLRDHCLDSLKTTPSLIDA